jgi:hypothetical protein
MELGLDEAPQRSRERIDFRRLLSDGHARSLAD